MVTIYAASKLFSFNEESWSAVAHRLSVSYRKVNGNGKQRVVENTQQRASSGENRDIAGASKSLE